jgi:rhodanese-related sulfurtransferase
MKKLLTLFCLTALAVFSAQAADKKIADISHDDLKKALADGKVTLIDVNGSASYKEGHIPGAIDFQSKKEDLAKLLPKEKDALIVAYCGNEHCSAYAKGAQAAIDLGYTNVKHYSAGIAGWKEKKEAVEQPKG